MTPEESKFRDALQPFETRLKSYINTKIPGRFRGKISPDDIFQEVAWAAYRERTTFDAISSEDRLRWLLTVTNNKLLNAIKAANRLKRGGGITTLQNNHSGWSSFVSNLQRVFSPEKSPSRVAALQEAREPLENAIAGLPEDRRRVIEQHFHEGKEIGEIAQDMKRSPTAIRSLLRHSLKQLRDKLGRASRFLSGTSEGRSISAPPDKSP